MSKPAMPKLYHAGNLAFGAEVWFKHEAETHIAELRASHDRLSAEVEALRKDAERLDWLIGEVADQGPGGFRLHWIEQKRSYLSGREAIDAAMARVDGEGGL